METVGDMLQFEGVGGQGLPNAILLPHLAQYDIEDHLVCVCQCHGIRIVID